MTRVREANQPKFPANWAELLFDLGRAVGSQVRRGAEIADAASVNSGGKDWAIENSSVGTSAPRHRAPGTGQSAWEV